MPVGGDEFELIARIRDAAPANASVTLGIGDDAALLCSENGGDLVVAKDVLAEGRHFDLSTDSPADVGRKALAVNLSDLAAMAARPTATFVGLVLSDRLGAAFAERLMQGLSQLAEEYGVALAGGDTNIWDGPLVVSVTVVGTPTGSGVVRREGARPGDWLMVTGALGGSFPRRHLSFTPRIHEAALLNTTVPLHAMIDLSDGLASDVQHLLGCEGLGVLIESDRVPVHADVDTDLPVNERVQHALSDGEDFELLLAVDPQTGRRLLDQPLFETPLTRIGEFLDQAGCWLVRPDGVREVLQPTGWQHRFGS